MPKFKTKISYTLSTGNLAGIYTLIDSKLKELGSIPIQDALSFILKKLIKAYGIKDKEQLGEMVREVSNYIDESFKISDGKIVSSKVSRRKVSAQADPLGALLGGPPMPAGQPGGMPPPEEQENLISGPIDSLVKLVNDAGVEEIIKTQPHLSEEEIALEVWEKYGGRENGKIDSLAVGERTDVDENRDFEEVKKEKEMQDGNNQSYKRLPRGQNLLDIGITLEDLTQAVKSMPFSIIQKVKGQAGGQQPGGMPGMGGMASAKFRQVRLAKFQEIRLPVS